MSVLDGDGDRRREGVVLGVNFLGRPIVSSGDGDALFANHFGENLSSFRLDVAKLSSGSRIVNKRDVFGEEIIVGNLLSGFIKLDCHLRDVRV